MSPLVRTLLVVALVLVILQILGVGVHIHFGN
jgi:hypothetical protein